MARLSLIPDRRLGPSDVDTIRVQAQDLGHVRDWAGLHALRPRLEQDGELWPDLWGPLCAIAAQRMGDPHAIDLLSDLVAAGFSQPQLLDSELEAAFADHERWPALAEQIASNVSPVPVELLDWPVLTPTAPLELLDLPGPKTELLRAVIPAPQPSGWQTAIAALGWVTQRWQHGNAHIDVDDALHCLQRVDEGHRFACVEYSLVLSQALNALSIPARRLWLRQEPYHVGVGRSHVVSEAWIDELERWVVLDGQNGVYWVDTDGTPLGAVELQRRLHTGRQPRHVTVSTGSSGFDATTWSGYFAHVSTTAGSWAKGAYGLVFQRSRLVISGRLERRPDALYPDLSEIGVRTALIDDRPGLQLSTAHPYATGFAVDGRPIRGDIVPLDVDAGEHTAQLAVQTPYTKLSDRPLHYRANDQGR